MKNPVQMKDLSLELNAPEQPAVRSPDDNPLFDTVSDQPEMFGTTDAGMPLMASGIGKAFREGIEHAVEAAPSVLDSTLEMSAEAVARHQELLEKNRIDIDIPDKAANINLKYLDAPEKVNQLIVDLAGMMPDKVEKARGGVQTWGQTQLLAEELGLTPKELLDRKQGEAWNAQSIYAARMMLAQARDDVDTLAQKIHAREANPQDMVEFRRMLSVYAGIQQQIHGMAAEAGRSLNQFKIAAQAGELRNRQLDAMLAQHGNASTERLAELWGVLDDPAQKARFAEKAHNAKGIDMVFEYWINSLLSAPSTHAVNILGNSLTAMWSLPEKAASTGISMLLRDNAIAPTEMSAQVWGLYRGSMDGIKLAWQVLKTREPTDPLQKIEARTQRAITGENVEDLINRGVKTGGKATNWMLRRDVVSPEDIELSGWVGRGVDALGTFIRYPGIALMAEDEFFKSIAYRMELNALAAREAWQEGLSGEEAAQRITAILNNPPESMHITAMDASHYRTFTNMLGPERKLQAWMNERPVMRFIMPFVRTPLNITAYSFERIPGLNLLVKRSRDELFSGDPARRDIAMGKLAMGTMFMTAAMPFVSQQFENVEGDFEITGAAPSDPALKSQWRRNHQEYSIRVGDEWYSYNRLDPLGQMLGIMADSVRIMRGLDDADLEEYSVAIVHAISNNLINKTYMSGVADFFEVFTSFDEMKWQRFVKRFASSFMPNIARRLEAQVDPTVRLTDNILEEFCSRSIGCSDKLPPMRNLWGEPIETGALGPTFVSPIFNMKQKYSAIDKELDRLQYPVRMPRRHMMGVDLPPQMYSDYVLLQGKQVVYDKGTQIGFPDGHFMAIGNLNMEQALSKMVQHDSYKQLTDHVDPPGQKVKMIRKMVEMYRASAQAHLLEKYPELLDSAALRRQAELEAAGMDPLDAQKMGMEYSATMRQTIFTNLQSRVKE